MQSGTLSAQRFVLTEREKVKKQTQFQACLERLIACSICFIIQIKLSHIFIQYIQQLPFDTFKSGIQTHTHTHLHNHSLTYVCMYVAFLLLLCFALLCFVLCFNLLICLVCCVLFCSKVSYSVYSILLF